MSKQDARDWQDGQRKIAQEAKAIEDLAISLHHVNKRKCNFPSVDQLRNLGLDDIANDVSRAYSLLSEAHQKFSIFREGLVHE